MTSKLPVVGKRYVQKDLNILVIWKLISEDFTPKGVKFYNFVNDNRHPCGEKYHISDSSFWDYLEELPDSNPQETPKEKIKISSDENYLRVDIENDGTTAFPIGTEIEIFRDSNKKEVSEVERALEELKSELKDWFEGFPDFFLSKPECNHTWAGKRIGDTCEDCDDKFFSKVRPFCQNGVYYTFIKAKSLIDALDAEKANRYNNTCTTPVVDLSKPEPKTDMKEERVEPVSIPTTISGSTLLDNGLNFRGIIRAKDGFLEKKDYPKKAETGDCWLIILGSNSKPTDTLICSKDTKNQEYSNFTHFYGYIPVRFRNVSDDVELVELIAYDPYCKNNSLAV